MRGTRPRVPVVLCIDVEPDGAFIDPARQPPWVGYERAYLFFQEIRQELAIATGSEAHFSWFYRMDPQISETYGSGAWPALAYPEYIRDLESNGDEIGIHTHLYRLDRKTGGWLIDNRDLEWVAHCIRSSYDAFERLFGRTSISHRFGDRLIDDRALNLVEELGSRFDLTVEPGFNEIPSRELRERMTGSLPDMRGVPKEPYRRSRVDFRKPDPARMEALWMLPLSTAEVRVGSFGLFSPTRFFSLHLALKPRYFRTAAKKLVKTLDRPYLAIALKTDMLKDASLASNMRHNLKLFVRGFRSRRFVFATPEEAMKILGYMNGDHCLSCSEASRR